MISLYAVARAPVRGPLGRGVQRERLRALMILGVAVVAGEVDAAPAVSKKALAVHDRVVRSVGSRAVLPMRYASVAPDLRAVNTFVRQRKEDITTALARVLDCEQFTLRLVFRRRVAKGGPGARWLRRRSAFPPEIAPLREAVAAFVKVERAQADGGVLSVYHLVEKRDRRAYRAALARALRALRGARASVSGPWPPYAFAEDP
jgi:hypothetical protein